MANTLAAALVPDRVSERVITVLQNKLAPLMSFSQDFGIDQLKPKAKVQVGKATAGSATLTNPTDFESGNSTLAAVEVTVNQKSQPFHLTNNEIQSGHKLDNLIDINAGAFANALIDIAFTPITVSNFGSKVITGAASTFDTDDLKTLWGAAKKFNTRNIILDGDYFAQFLPTNRDSFVPGAGAYGYDGFYLNTRWDGADTAITGFVCDPSAIAVASGLPIVTSAVGSEMTDSRVIEIEGLGLSVQLNHWVSLSGRAEWMSLDVMFGAAAGDTTAGKLIASA